MELMLHRAYEVDDLRPFYRQQQFLGYAVALGGILGAVRWFALVRMGEEPSMQGLFTACAAVWLGLLHILLGAGWLENLQASRLMREIETRARCLVKA